MTTCESFMCSLVFSIYCVLRNLHTASCLQLRLFILNSAEEQGCGEVVIYHKPLWKLLDSEPADHLDDENPSCFLVSVKRKSCFLGPQQVAPGISTARVVS